MKILQKSIITSALLLITGSASAADWEVTGKVTFIEATYAPSTLPFRINVAAGVCPAGSPLIWSPIGVDAQAKVANFQAILATLMVAKSTAQSITLIGDNAGQFGCTVRYVYLI